jgi:uncharacterized integral membrane protein
MEAQGPTPEKRGTSTWALVLFAALAVYALLLIILNDDKVDVSFVFFTAEISKLVLILLCLGIGFTIGFLFDRIRAHRRDRTQSPT